ncbi:MAG TPA: DNA repair protein RecO [Alphaproteobacteria bacterium]|nr:DNA repair protein RecO [Alphaproteobacteria bacterium]
MEWTDRAIVLSLRPHGDSGAVAALLTESHGRHGGLLHGGPKSRAGFEPGTEVVARWRGRLPEHLGHVSLESERNHAASLLDDRLRLSGLTALCAVAEAALPERQPLPGVHAATKALLELFDTPHWPAAYVQWELGLLGALGYGLDLQKCAATGANDQLAYVSPKTGRAVSLAAGEPYRDRLLPLPGFLIGLPGAGLADAADGLALTGYFLEARIFAPQRRPLPPARVRLAEALRKAANTMVSLPA